MRMGEGTGPVIVAGLLAVATIDGDVMVRLSLLLRGLDPRSGPAEGVWETARSAPRRASAVSDAEGANARAGASIVDAIVAASSHPPFRSIGVLDVLSRGQW